MHDKQPGLTAYNRIASSTWRVTHLHQDEQYPVPQETDQELQKDGSCAKVLTVFQTDGIKLEINSRDNRKIYNK